MKIIHHDVKQGYLKKCQVCNSKKLKLIINLGRQPLADTLLKKKLPSNKVKRYPLAFYRCLSCGLTQLNYVVSGKKVYHKNYPYRPGITNEVVEHHSNRADEAIKRFNIIML